MLPIHAKMFGRAIDPQGEMQTEPLKRKMLQAGCFESGILEYAIALYIEFFLYGSRYLQSSPNIYAHT